MHEARKRGESCILVVHYEALAIIAGKSGRGWDKYGKWDMIVSDETHRIKNVRARMTRALKKVPTVMKLALSGSIIQNHAEELFSPLQWLYPRRYRSKWRDWNDRYLDYVEGGYSKVFVGIKLEELENLRRELGVIMVYRRKEDELDLPERIDDNIHVELTPGQRKIYDELVGTCVAKLDDDSFVAAEDGLPMLTKLRQIATGLDLVGEDVHDSSKLDLAAEMIEDNVDEQFVVFSWFKAACNALAHRLGEGVVITSDVTQDKRDPLIRAFMAGEERILIATIGTMGESQNLQNANNAIFLDRSWNPADNTQAEDRIYRYGQDKKVTITHLIAKDTVDEHRVTPTIVNKEALRRMILGG
jgi:SNF2 family DNA or RNA helicase